MQSYKEVSYFVIDTEYYLAAKLGVVCRFYKQRHSLQEGLMQSPHCVFTCLKHKCRGTERASYYLFIQSLGTRVDGLVPSWPRGEIEGNSGLRQSIIKVNSAEDIQYEEGTSECNVIYT